MADAGSSLARSRVHRALSRPNLLMGADRELVLLTALAAIILIFVVLTWYAALFGIAIWLVAVAALRMMAKSDPVMRRGLSPPHLLQDVVSRDVVAVAQVLRDGSAQIISPFRTIVCRSGALCRPRR